MDILTFLSPLYPPAPHYYYPLQHATTLTREMRRDIYGGRAEIRKRRNHRDVRGEEESGVISIARSRVASTATSSARRLVLSGRYRGPEGEGEEFLSRRECVVRGAGLDSARRDGAYVANLLIEAGGGCPLARRLPGASSSRL